jgi:flagellar basal body-associated protein FliL
MSTLATIIAVIAILFACGCFIVYLVVTLKHVPAAQEKADQTVRQLNPAAVAGVSAKEIAELVKALASLAEALAKAGPALWSLIGSVLFLLIAALAAGLIISVPERTAAPNSKPAANASANDSNVVGNETNQTTPTNRT